MKYNIMLLVLLFGCSKAPEGWNAIGRPYHMRLHPEQRKLGPNHDWTKGFNDGCVTAMESLASGLFRVNKPRVDGWKLTGRDPKNPEKPHPEIKSGKIYSKGWFDGYEHCTYQYDWWVL